MAAAAPACASEGAAVAPAVARPAGALLVGHVLRDGELVILLMRPSRWFILLSSLRFLAIVAILMTLAAVSQERLHYSLKGIVEAGIFVMAGRLMWAVLQWMGRLYILTDLRILSISGVFNSEVFDCPLRKVARALREATLKEQIVRIGSILIIPQDEQMPPGSWRMIPRPREIYEKVLATIARAKQGG